MSFCDELKRGAVEYFKHSVPFNLSIFIAKGQLKRFIYRKNIQKMQKLFKVQGYKSS